MARQYTRSRDGVNRTDLLVKIRLSKPELEQLEERARREEMSLQSYLQQCLREGIWAAWWSEEQDENTDDHES